MYGYDYGSALEEDFASISQHPSPGAIMPSPYGALALRQNYGEVTDQDLDQMQAELEDIAIEVESAAIVAGEEISSAVRETRGFAEHRKFLYMVGAPAIVIAGISNQKYRMLGIFAAAVGAYVGVKNYQDEQAAKSGGYGATGLTILPKVKRSGPACVRPRRDGKCPPRHPHARHMANGRKACCRR
jgi:hypothetical protein